MQINAFRILLYLIFIKLIKMMMKDKYLSNYDNIKNNDMIQSTITDKQRVNYNDHNNCRIFQFVESKFNCETIWKI